MQRLERKSIHISQKLLSNVNNSSKLKTSVYVYIYIFQQSVQSCSASTSKGHRLDVMLDKKNLYTPLNLKQNTASETNIHTITSFQMADLEFHSVIVIMLPVFDKYLSTRFLN